MCLKAGDAFLMRPSDRLAYHLYVVLTDPSPSGEIVIINFTSDRNGSYLRGCGHSFIEHPSRLVFAETDTPKEKAILSLVKWDDVVISDSVSDALLRRIKADCKASPLFPTYLKRRI
jgi:hypothetical protein